MGQYYKFVSVDKEKSISPINFDNGSKLMEHSWLNNNYVGAAMQLISKGQPFYGDKIVWAGDYADNEIKNGKKLRRNLYNLCSNYKIAIKIDENNIKKLRYLVNLDTKEFVDISKSPISNVWIDPETRKKHSYCIHPLPLLTCEGNGRGCGDFSGEDPNNLVGKWHRNRVVSQKQKPRNCKELIFDLVEK